MKTITVNFSGPDWLVEMAKVVVADINAILSIKK